MKALNGVNNNGRFSTLPPNNTVRVLMTLSLAINPLKKAVDIRQSFKPSGWNIGSKASPMAANKLRSEVAATFNRLSKVCKNQMIMVAIKIMVKALVIKPLALAKTNWAMLRGVGKR